MMQARIDRAVRTRAMVSGAWAVQCTDTATGPSDGGIHQPLNPPSTSCGGPRPPAAVDADHESWKPSPSTSQQPSGQLSTVISRPVRDCDVTVAVGPPAATPGAGRSGAARTTRSTSRPVSRPFVVANRCVPAVSDDVDPSHGSAVTALPASRSAVDPCTRSGSGRPSIVTRSSRQPLSKVVGIVVAVMPERSLIAAGSTTGSP